MDLRADLHLHTTASDGRWTPRELIAEVQRAGIDIFAVTDHDSLDNLAETIELVRGSGLYFLPGVELSVRLNGQLYHLLAYGFDLADPDLNALVRANNALLGEGNEEAIRLLIQAGYPISLDDYATYTWDRSRGGWKAINFLIDSGICRDVRGYFGELFGGDLAHPEPCFPPLQEAIDVVRRAGGVVLLAHPGVPYYNGPDERRLDAMVEMGIQGLECFAPSHDRDSTRRFIDYCWSHDLLITGGSDCHGGFAGRALGVPPVYASDLRLGILKGMTIA